MIEHFQVQYALGIAVPATMLLYHFSKRGTPGNCTIEELFKLVPYIVLIVGLILVIVLRRKHGESYHELRHRSPGGELRGEAPLTT